MTTDESIETEIQCKGLTAPRVTPQRIEAVIDSTWYLSGSQAEIGALSAKYEGADLAGLDRCRSPLDLLTICVLVLDNGFTVTGESACASPENFDAELGRKIARQNAVAKIWPLEGYLLKQQLHDQLDNRHAV